MFFGDSKVKIPGIKGFRTVKKPVLYSWISIFANFLYHNISYPHENEKKWNSKANLYLMIFSWFKHDNRRVLINTQLDRKLFEVNILFRTIIPPKFHFVVIR